MEGIYEREFTRPYTHVRLLALRLSPATGHILEVCRAEMVLDDERVWHDAPHTLRLRTAADEGEAPLRFAATPLLLAQTLWTPGPPHVLASYDPAIWERFTGPVLGGVARLDVRRLVRQLWPAAPTDDLGAILKHLGMAGMVDRIPARPPETPLQLDVRRCMTLLTTLYTVHAGTLLLLRDAAFGKQPTWLAQLLGPQAPDAVVQAMVNLAALPMGTDKAALPDSGAADATWTRVPTDDLIWIAGQDRLSRTLRHRADAELGRRLREQGGSGGTPGLVLRRLGRLARI